MAQGDVIREHLFKDVTVLDGARGAEPLFLPTPSYSLRHARVLFVFEPRPKLARQHRIDGAKQSEAARGKLMRPAMLFSCGSSVGRNSYIRSTIRECKFFLAATGKWSTVAVSFKRNVGEMRVPWNRGVLRNVCFERRFGESQVYLRSASAWLR